jgi:hypothetical protein
VRDIFSSRTRTYPDTIRVRAAKTCGANPTGLLRYTNRLGCLYQATFCPPSGRVCVAFFAARTQGNSTPSAYAPKNRRTSYGWWAGTRKKVEIGNETKRRALSALRVEHGHGKLAGQLNLLISPTIRLQTVSLSIFFFGRGGTFGAQPQKPSPGSFVLLRMTRAESGEHLRKPTSY